MSQQTINQEEWNKPGNWKGIFYSSRTDTRLMVPKRRGYGQTFNFARPMVYALLGGLMVTLVGAVVLVARLM